MIILAYIGIGLGAFVGAYIVYMLVIANIPGISVPAQSLEQAQTPNPRTEVEGRRVIDFEVDETRLSAWLYLPRDLSPSIPCVIMAHGLGGTKAMGLDRYARRFQRAGYAVFVFDYRYLGESDGEPRQLVWIPHQLADWRAAIERVRGLEEIDPSKIALWGTSLSGGHVVVTAARDQGIACISAQCPLLDGDAGGIEALRRLGLGHALKMALVHALRDLVRSLLGRSPHKIPLFGQPGTMAAMADAGAWRLATELAPEGFVNEVCARILLRMDKYHPIAHTAKVRCPVLLQVCDKDISLPMSVVEKAEKNLGELAQVIRYPIDHFDIYLGDDFEKAVSDQIAFFEKHL
jgi:fermentation-respiration switch protein FrsA (DUF1100 family)